MPLPPKVFKPFLVAEDKIVYSAVPGNCLLKFLSWKQKLLLIYQLKTLCTYIHI